MVKINSNIDKIVENITNNLQTIEYVEAIVAYGRQGPNSVESHFDEKLIIYVQNREDYEKMEKTVRYEITKQIWEFENNIAMEFDMDDKWVLYTQKNLINFEIKIKKIAESAYDIVHVAESITNFPEKSIKFDRNGALTQIYKTFWQQFNNNEQIGEHFQKEINSFIYYFGIFLQNLAKHDQYNAYMNYTIAYFKLATLISIVEGEYYNLFQPKNFLSKVVKDFDVKKLFLMSTVKLDQTEMVDAQDNLVELFLKTIKKGIEQFSLEVDEAHIITFISDLMNKYSNLEK